jgi:hypothetical protein
MALPLVIDRTRTVTLGGERLSSERLLVEMHDQSLADVQAMLRSISAEVIAEQARAGNPPQVVEVDGGAGRPVDDANKKVVAIFGVELAAAAMREVEGALRDAIQASTHAHSGRLAGVSGGSWQWLYIAKGQTARPVTAGSTLPAFQRGDQLVLRPVGVPYATRVNQLVAGAGRLNPKARLVKGKLREPPKRMQNAGFLFHAAEALRRRSAFVQFHVRVVFSRVHLVSGEVMSRTSGTGMIVISPRLTRSRV